MSNHELALFILGAINAIVIPWAIWVTSRLFNIDKDVAVQKTVTDGVSGKLDNLEEELKEISKNMELNFRELLSKIK